MLFAHISDIHLPITKSPHISELCNKSFLSFLSWHHKRKNRHLLEVVNALKEDMACFNPEHFCITGDMVNAALRTELEGAKAWLEALDAPEKISFVPGNHDALTKRAAREKEKYFGKWMRAEKSGKGFPYVHLRNNVAFIGVDSAIPTPVFSAQGRVGEEQMAKLANLLEETKKEGFFRVVMLHHPPLPGQSKCRKKLLDCRTMETVLQEKGAELVLHGHEHRSMMHTLESVDGVIPIFGAGSASLVRPNKGWFSQYNLFEVDGGKLIKTIRRVYDTEKKTFVPFTG